MSFSIGHELLFIIHSRYSDDTFKWIGNILLMTFYINCSNHRLHLIQIIDYQYKIRIVIEFIFLTVHSSVEYSIKTVFHSDFLVSYFEVEVLPPLSLLFLVSL